MKFPLRSTLILLCLAFFHGLPVSAQPGTHRVDHIVAGFTRGSIPELNLRDLEASFKALTTALGRKRGYDISMKIRVFDKRSDFEKAIQQGEIQMAIIDAWDYLDMKLPPTMEPAFVHAYKQGVLKHYLLLTRRQAVQTSCRDLRGTDIVLLRNSTCLMSEHWLDALLAQEHLGAKEVFFRKVEVVQNPTAAMLPVFFGKRPACVVEDTVYQTMVEMNPQVNVTLQVVASSPAYLNSITFLNTRGWSSAQARLDFASALRDLHLDPEGRQLLLLFKVDRMLPFKPNDLDSVRELRAKDHSMMPKQRPGP